MTKGQIELFISTAQLGSFTLAAEKHYSTQPTVSRQISLLEEELGFALIDRSSKKIKLTDEGEIMLEAFKKSIKEIAEGEERVALSKQGLTGSISVGVAYGTNRNEFVFPEATTFVKDNPQVNFSIGFDTFSVLRNKLESGEYDVIFTPSFDLPSYEKVNYRNLYNLDPLIVMSSKHPLAKKKDLTSKDFEGQLFLWLESKETRGMEQIIVKSIEQRWGISVKTKPVKDVVTMLFHIENNGCFGTLDSSMYVTDEPGYFCYYFDLGDAPEKLHMSMVWKKDNNNKVLRKFLKYYKAVE